MATIHLLAEMFSRQRLTNTRLSDDSGVLVDTSTLQLLAVNETGQALVDALKGGARSTGELVARLVDEFEVDEAKAEKDVASFVEELHGLLPDIG
jgi:hypothetical protein